MASLNLIAEILAAQGGQKFYTDWDIELAERIKRRAANKRIDELPVINLGQRHLGIPEYRLRVTTHGGTPARRFQYDECKKTAPDLYRRHVTITPAEIPLTVTLRAKGKRRSETWDGLRSVGWQRAAEKIGSGREGTDLISIDKAGERLLKVRDRTRELASRERDLRAELSTWILTQASLHEDRMPDLSSGDGAALIKPAADKRSINLDLAQSRPDLARFIKIGAPTAEYTKVWFQVVGEDDPEGDEDPFEGD